MRPAIEIRTPVLFPSPLCVAERAPPAAWRIRDTMSHGMKNQIRNLGLKCARERSRWLMLVEEQSGLVSLVRKGKGQG
jgi:hypothetical protein